MYHEFHKYIQDEQLFVSGHKLLLGVSGGVDSVVLAHLIDKLGNEFAIAHCNFNLRGEASIEDEKFVENLALSYGVKFYQSSFQTSEIARERGISIEMAARDLRYDWFERIRETKGYNCIVVGHHLDDVLETFLLNLSRGTGIRGLSGIKPSAGRVVRPLLFAPRHQIVQYANENGLSFRYDVSNDDVVFKRNKVRHEVLPLLEELNPAFRKNLSRTIAALNETETIFLQKIDEVKSKLLQEEGSWMTIDIPSLKELHPQVTYLFELLRPYHFNIDTVRDILYAIDGQPGNQFFSRSHRIVIDRDKLIITELDKESAPVFYIEKGTKFIDQPYRMRFSIQRYSDDFKIPTSPDIAVLDYDRIRFPLLIRKWKQGEYFKPLGMYGFKKLSDYFIDQKLSIPEKEAMWILYSENKVVWIMGQRLDDRYKITPATKLVLRIEKLNAND